jgi:hypothetical protein
LRISMQLPCRIWLRGRFVTSRIIPSDESKRQSVIWELFIVKLCKPRKAVLPFSYIQLCKI